MSDPKSARSNDPIVCLHEILDGIGEINRWRRDVDEWRKKVDDRLDEGNREFQRQSDVLHGREVREQPQILEDDP